MTEQRDRRAVDTTIGVASVIVAVVGVIIAFLTLNRTPAPPPTTASAQPVSPASPTTTPTTVTTVQRTTATPLPAKADRPTENIPARFIGVWKGKATQTNTPSGDVTFYPTIRLHASAVGDSAGSYSFTVPNYETCQFSITLQDASQSSIDLSTAVMAGPDCAGGTITLTFRSDGRLNYHWVGPSNTAEGTLSRL